MREYKSDEWKELVKQEDHCYEAVCEGNEAKLKMRKNATDWEDYESECFQHVCENVSGRKAFSKCKNYEMCVDDKCEKNLNDESLMAIEVELSGVNASDYDSDEVKKSISEASGVDASSPKIGAEANDAGQIVHVFILVRDDESVERVMKAVERCIGYYDSGASTSTL